MHIERVSPELDRIVSPDQSLEILGGGLGGEHEASEGPVWWKEAGYLIFSDIAQNRRMKWAPGKGITVVREGSNKANGLTRDPKGRLVACEGTTRRVTRFEDDGDVTVVADRYRGNRLNRPNDVVVKSDGNVYFTDPSLAAPDLELDFAGVFRVSPDLSDVTLLVEDFEVPNGLAFSPDESILYINDTGRYHVRAFDVLPDGSVDRASDRVLLEMERGRRGVPDGMKLDVEGNLYCTGPGGIWITDPGGRHLGTILVGEHTQATNVAWGDDDLRTLYVTLMNELARIRLKIPGVPVQQGL